MDFQGTFSIGLGKSGISPGHSEGAITGPQCGLRVEPEKGIQASAGRGPQSLGGEKTLLQHSSSALQVLTTPEWLLYSLFHFNWR